MVQESTMICLDNSEWMRNGDFTPTRLQCQQDAANLVIQCKLRSNPENAVGIISMANTVEVLSTLTQENGRLFMKLHQVEPKGESNVIGGIKIAHLALKHRQNRNHKMRIVVFIGSPVNCIDRNELAKLSKKLKKEKVVVDIICFGEADGDSNDIFGQFIESLNSREGGGSNLIVVSSGSTLTEALVSSSVCRGEDGTAAPVVAASGGGFEFGIDPEDDPDLALACISHYYALRVSLEEQRQRQMQEANAELAGADSIRQQADVNDDFMNMDPEAMTEDQQLAWALRMSMQEGPSAKSSEPAEKAKTAGVSDKITIANEMEIDQIPEEKEVTAEEDQLGQLIDDPELLRQLVADLPGMDQGSPEIQNVLQKGAASNRDEKTDPVDKSKK
ncbi:unnamed protein product [Dracunculus medinensis]|uniref:26S proteasome non-ATPase regulatory subunit 4 n=1 Tax=Dracunculus medinensis TaxID=318479 RepID=A0A0N4U972_DRAME|nr:unnamed protein product [Dracunculus medinensis]